MKRLKFFLFLLPIWLFTNELPGHTNQVKTNPEDVFENGKDRVGSVIRTNAKMEDFRATLSKLDSALIEANSRIEKGTLDSYRNVESFIVIKKGTTLVLSCGRRIITKTC